MGKDAFLGFLKVILMCGHHLPTALPVLFIVLPMNECLVHCQYGFRPDFCFQEKLES